MSTEYPVYKEQNPNGTGVDVRIAEARTELSLVVTATGHEFDPNTAETKPLSMDEMVEIVANLVRPYTYQYPGPDGRGFIDKLKNRLEDVWHGR